MGTVNKLIEKCKDVQVPIIQRECVGYILGILERVRSVLNLEDVVRMKWTMKDV